MAHLPLPPDLGPFGAHVAPAAVAPLKEPSQIGLVIVVGLGALEFLLILGSLAALSGH